MSYKWTNFTRKGGVRKVIKVYGLKDPAKKHPANVKVRKPFAQPIQVSPKF